MMEIINLYVNFKWTLWFSILTWSLTVKSGQGQFSSVQFGVYYWLTSLEPIILPPQVFLLSFPGFWLVCFSGWRYFTEMVFTSYRSCERVKKCETLYIKGRLFTFFTCYSFILQKLLIATFTWIEARLKISPPLYNTKLFMRQHQSLTGGQGR